MSERMLHFDGFGEPFENWSKLPHTMIDALPLVSSLSELKVILYVLRHTWGYKEYDSAKHITMDEFVNGRKKKDGTRMDNGVGMSEPSIRLGIKYAQEHGFLAVEIDETDKARVEKSFKLIINANEQGERSLPPEGKKLSPSPKTSLPRSEKETLDEKLKKDGAGKPRRINPLFELVAKTSFGIADTSVLDKSSGARIGKIAAWLKKHEATTENLEAFYLWYCRETSGASHLRDLDKFAEWYVKFELALTKAASVSIIPFDPTKWTVPELEQVS